MKLTPIPPHIFVDQLSAWEKCLEALQKEPILAIDLESNGMYVYSENICLIQISTPTQDYIVDPLAQLDLAPLGELIEDARVQKIFHAAEYDMILMKQEHDWDLHNLFDTMWAARILGYERVGLANILDELFGVQLDKRFQRTDWGKRPLSKAQLAYAQRDTHYLFSLRQHLLEALDKAGLVQEAEEIFAEQAQVKLPDTSFSTDDFWSINGVRNMPPASQAVLKELNIFRDAVARKKNLPLFKVMGNKTLVAIAERLPQNEQELGRIRGMSSAQVRRYGRQILRIVRQKQNGPYPRPPKRPPRLPESVMERYEALHLWRKERGVKRGVDSDVIMSRGALWAIAHANPHTEAELGHLDEVGEWRLHQYGQEILALLKELETKA